MFKTLPELLSLTFDYTDSRPKFVGMKLLHNIRTFLVPLIFTVVPFAMKAGGFQSNFNDVRSASMGGAFAPVATGSASVFANPGAMAFQELSSFSLGASFRLQANSFLSPYSGNFDSEKSLRPGILLSGLYKINEKSAAGISVNTPFASYVKWADDWTGKYIAIESYTRTICVQPAYSFQVSESFGIGGGPVIGLSKNFLSKAMPYGGASGPVMGEFEGKTTSYGFALGMYLASGEKFKMALTYRSAMNAKIDNGEATFSNVPGSLAGEYPSSAGYTSEYKLPSVISAGAGYQLTRDLLLSVQLDYTGWKVYDEVNYTFEEASQLNFNEEKNYKNVIALKFGARIHLNDKIEIMGGVGFDNSPVPDATVLPDNPDNDRFLLSLGGTIRFTETIALDAGWQLENYKEREVNNTSMQFSGSYKTISNNFGLALNYEF